MNDDAMKRDAERHAAAAHAMQSGVAMEMEVDPDGSATSPKHLRVGINAAMADHAGLAGLLISKGIITEAEYVAALAEKMEAEKARYEQLLSAKLRSKITLT